MFRKSVVFVCLAALALSSASLLIAQPQKPEENHSTGLAVRSAIDEQAMKLKMKDDPVDLSGPRTRALAEPRRTSKAGEEAGGDKGGPVSIVYDDGINTAAPTTSSFCYGNQFNTANGNAVNSFSITMATFYMAGLGGTGAFVSIFGALNTAGTATVGTNTALPESILVGGLAAGAFNTFTLATPVAGAGSFQAGIWYFGGDSVGLGAGTVGGQGHHGMLINDFNGTGFSTLPGLNALFRVKTAFIPVELMDFTVTDN